MSAFLFLLVKLNLAMGMAILLVALLRRPLRAWFGAAVAYAIWFLVPIAGLACLLPPRVVTPAHVAPVHLPATSISVTSLSVINHIAPSALRVAEQLTAQGAATIAAAPRASAYQLPDTALLLFAAWALGLVLMVLYLTRLQARFHAAARLGQTGPAVLGFLRLRIVTPAGFQDRFTPREQAAILAHERVHLARQDARINGLVALLRCLCWFNPLIHLGARWLRIDQELACDATAVAGGVSRRTYAKALLKSQMVIASLPVGCNWPGSQHPLIERIALLKRKPPGVARRVAGAGFVMLVASCAGLGAWAAQPPVAAKPVTAGQAGMMRVMLPPAVAAPGQAARESAADANPIPSGNNPGASKKVRADRATLPALAPVRVQMAGIGSIQAQVLSALAAPPSIASFSAPPDRADPSPTSQDASPEAKEIILAKNTGKPATGEATAVGALSVTATDTVVPNTPSGVGDPNAIVCRAPQRIAGSDQSGPEACGHNYEWWRMAIAGKDLAADGKTLIDKPMVKNPTGEGDPDAVTCRTPQFVMLGPLVEVCRTNRFWAAVIENHDFVDAHGVVMERTWPSGGDYGSPGSGGPVGSADFTSPYHDSGYPAQSSARQP